MTQQRWLCKLMGYDFHVKYKKDGGNIVVDALSCHYETKPIE